MEKQKLEKFECEITAREYTFVGLSITSNFPSRFPEAAVKVQTELQARKNEIMNAKDQEVLYSPYMCNGILATYFACLEVSDLSKVPSDMIGFKLPLSKYAKINCTNKSIHEAYGRLFDWMNQNGYKQKFLDNSCPIEIYYIEENEEEEDVEILIPILD